MWTQALLRKLQKSKTAKYGIPMLLLVVGGSFGLREFTQIRYDVHIIKKKMDPALEALINPKTQPVVLEEEFEKLKKTDLHSWKNIRGPRPWEDSQEYEEQKRANFSKGRTGTPGPS